MSLHTDDHRQQQAAQPAAPLRLTPDVVAFIQSPVSILVSSQGIDGLPVLARAIVALVTPDGDRIRLCLRSHDAAALLQGAAAHGQVAAMFSRPSTSETIQIKGNAVVIEDTLPADDAARRRYLPAMITELMPLGHGAELVACIVSDHGSPLRILSFRPSVVFDQTPGPGAGEPRSR